MFSAGVERALRAAELAHRGQARKGSDSVPYVLHPVHCAILLARLGYPDTVLQAALLHDVVEDCEGWSVARVETEFGTEVADIVAQLTEDKSKTWEERKAWQIEHARDLTAPALAVKAADKIHNLSSMAADLLAAADHQSVWRRFTGGRERTIQLSRALVDALALRVDPQLKQALLQAMSDVEQAASTRHPLP